MDLAENAEQAKEFYGAVVDWTFSEQPMRDYVDFDGHNPAENNEIISGICHKKASNSKIPAQWLNYVIVDNLEKSLENCINLGGRTLDGPREMGKDLFAVIQDPARHVWHLCKNYKLFLHNLVFLVLGNSLVLIQFVSKFVCLQFYVVL